MYSMIYAYDYTYLFAHILRYVKLIKLDAISHLTYSFNSKYI